MNVVSSFDGAEAAICLMEALLSGLRSACSDAKVRRRPALVGAALVVAVSDTGGGAGGADPAGGSGGAIGLIDAVCGTASGITGWGADGTVCGADRAAWGTDSAVAFEPGWGVAPDAPGTVDAVGAADPTGAASRVTTDGPRDGENGTTRD